MAPDTDPTDEELALVMREARDLAVQRRATADAWVAARLQKPSASLVQIHNHAGPTSLDDGPPALPPRLLVVAGPYRSFPPSNQAAEKL